MPSPHLLYPISPVLSLHFSGVKRRRCHGLPQRRRLAGRTWLHRPGLPTPVTETALDERVVLLPPFPVLPHPLTKRQRAAMDSQSRHHVYQTRPHKEARRRVTSHPPSTVDPQPSFQASTRYATTSNAYIVPKRPRRVANHPDAPLKRWRVMHTRSLDVLMHPLSLSSRRSGYGKAILLMNGPYARIRSGASHPRATSLSGDARI